MIKLCPSDFTGNDMAHILFYGGQVALTEKTCSVQIPTRAVFIAILERVSQEAKEKIVSELWEAAEVHWNEEGSGLNESNLRIECDQQGDLYLALNGIRITMLRDDPLSTIVKVAEILPSSIQPSAFESFLRMGRNDLVPDPFGFSKMQF